MIYADNSATSYFKPDTVKQAVMDYLSHPGNPGRSQGNTSLNASRMVLETRLLIQAYFDAPSFERVVFTSGVTESLNIVIQGLIKENDHVITTHLEHNSVLRPLYLQGCSLSVTDGTPEEISRAIKPCTKAVIVNHASNVTGEVQNIREIGRICREKGVLFVVDTAQTAGVLNISMKDDNIDILCFTGHKGLMGIQGIGGLVFTEEVNIPSFKVGGSGILSFSKEHPQEYPTRLEAGTLNVPGIISLYEGIRFVKDKNILSHEKTLRDTFVDGIKNTDGVTVYENKNKDYVGIASINIDGCDAAVLGDILSSEYGIETRAGAHCAPLVHEHYGTASMVRFSFGYNNTLSDIQECIRAVKEISRRYR